jgi:hypothetical protein
MKRYVFIRCFFSSSRAQVMVHGYQRNFLLLLFLDLFGGLHIVNERKYLLEHFKQNFFLFLFIRSFFSQTKDLSSRSTFYFFVQIFHIKHFIDIKKIFMLYRSSYLNKSKLVPYLDSKSFLFFFRWMLVVKHYFNLLMF